MAYAIQQPKDGDVPQVAELLQACFGQIERWDEERIRELMGHSGPQASVWWLAAEGSRVAGCVRVHGLPRPGAYVIRELAVRRRESAILDGLLSAAMEYLARARATLLRASTPNIPPYPEAYRRRGFIPVRRAVSLAWDLSTSTWRAPTLADVAVVDALHHPPTIIAKLYVEGMQPYWNWYIEERGGATSFNERVADHFASGPHDDELWLVAEHAGEPVGLAGASELGTEEAVFEGVYVLPDHRRRGVGAALMEAMLAAARQRTRRLVVAETVTFLEGDTPSVRLYRRSGARLRATYLHLQPEPRSA